MVSNRTWVIGFVLVFTLTFSYGEANADQIDILSNVPDYAWYDGCAPTSSIMLMAYYAINGYDGLSYTNLLPGAPLSTFTTSPNYSASSTAQVENAISTMATDMGTVNGSTTVHYYTNGNEFTASDGAQYRNQGGDLTYGLSLYVKNAGYTANTYTQAVSSAGFTFADFEADINAGMPVLIEIEGVVDGQEEGHVMLGYGYDATTDTIDVRDTWDLGGDPGVSSDGITGTMSWTGTYDDMSIFAVTSLTLSGGTDPVPEPATMVLFGTGLIGLAEFARRKKA